MTSDATRRAVVHEPGGPTETRRSGLLRLADARGIVAGIALDHRDSFRSWLARAEIGVGSDDDLRAIKASLTRVLAPAATVVMLDAELGGRALDSGAVPGTTGLIMPLEAQGYDAGGDDRLTTLMEDFTPADAARLGADACKLLVPYRPDIAATADRQDRVIAEAVAACRRANLPLVVEPVVYRRSTDADEDFRAAYPGLVIEAVDRIRGLGPDLLKLPFPAAPGSATRPAEAAPACEAVDGAADGVPWVLLGAGADGATFVEQLRVAGAAGASGFLAGRGIWGPALDRDPEIVEQRAAAISLPLLQQCREIAEAVARPLPGAV
jgi:sulfofructosephosphate aldolase